MHKQMLTHLLNVRELCNKLPCNPQSLRLQVRPQLAPRLNGVLNTGEATAVWGSNEMGNQPHHVHQTTTGSTTTLTTPTLQHMTGTMEPQGCADKPCACRTSTGRQVTPATPQSRCGYPAVPTPIDSQTGRTTRPVICTVDWGCHGLQQLRTHHFLELGIKCAQGHVTLFPPDTPAQIEGNGNMVCVGTGSTATPAPRCHADTNCRHARYL